jgi:prepilin-type N-terminal cleavage/methylation domain-containing protein
VKKSFRSSIADDESSDSGMTLVEVIVAIAIIAVVALSAGSLTILGLNSATTQERRQIAVTIASGAMEAVNAQSPKTLASTGVSGLLTGRTQAVSDTAWGLNTGVLGLGQTYETWDKTATALSVPTIATTPTVVPQAGTNFSVTTLIGTCFQPIAGGDCSHVSGYPNTAPSSVPSGLTALIRVIVVVRWSAGASCTVSSCSYSTSSLFDPHSDLKWVSHG